MTYIIVFTSTCVYLRHPCFAAQVLQVGHKSFVVTALSVELLMFWQFLKVLTYQSKSFFVFKNPNYTW